MTLWALARARITDAIAASATPDVIDGGIWDRPLAKQGGQRPTLAAFTATGAMRINIVVPEPSEERHPQADEVPNAAIAELVIWYYAQDSDPGHAAIAALRGIVFPAFQDPDSGQPVPIELADGRLAFPEWAGHQATRQNQPEFDGSIIGNTRFLVTFQQG